MNYLAHIYLSGTDKGCRIGGFIADAVKGSALEHYPDNIRRGILLHRRIDGFTDNHPLVREFTKELRDKFGRYAVVLPDMYFDHLLAVHFNEYAGISLRRFAYGFYLSLFTHYRFLPSRIRGFMWHFILTNRLYRYKSITGLKESLDIMATYDRIVMNVDDAVSYFITHQERIDRLFQEFFPQLQAAVRSWQEEK